MFALLLSLSGAGFAFWGKQDESPNLVEICTRHGKVLVDPSALPEGGPELPASAGHADHCPLCGLRNAPPIPIVPRFLPTPSALSERPPFLFFAAPRPLFIWTVPAPRGPPPSV